jgi:hypothetical protein
VKLEEELAAAALEMAGSLVRATEKQTEQVLILC